MTHDMANGNQRTAGEQPPISAHPAFPAIVALWFAALFGIGCLVLPTILVERVVTATALPAVFEAAAPPLGFTARLTLAVAAALFGAVAGLVLARKVTTRHAMPAERKRAPDRRPAGKAAKPKPIIATVELGEEGLGPVNDSWGLMDDLDGTDDTAAMPGAVRPSIGGRRRALSVTEEGGRSEFFDTVPLPGQDRSAPAETVDAGSVAEADEQADLHADDALDLAGFDEDLRAQADEHAHEHKEALARLRNAEREPAVSQPPAGQAAQGALEPTPAGEDDFASHSDHAGDPAEAVRPFDVSAAPAPPATEESPMTVTPYNPFAAPSEDNEEVAASAQAEPGREPTGSWTLPDTSQAPERSPDPAPASAGDPLAGMAMSDLVARFARSLQAKREEQAIADATPLVFRRTETPAKATALATEAPAPVSEPADAYSFPLVRSAAAGEPERPAFDGIISMTATVPPALRPLDLAGLEGEADDEDSEEDDSFALGAASLTRAFARPASVEAPTGPRPFGAPHDMVPVPDRVEGETNEAEPDTDATDDADTIDDAESGIETDNDAYSSLLSMKRPIGNANEFVRIEADDEDAPAEAAPEPAVIFPGQEDMASTRPSGGTPTHGASATPASSEARPFDPPEEGARSGGLSGAPSTAPAQRRADPAETEKALREALEKLQKMSGTG